MSDVLAAARTDLGTIRPLIASFKRHMAAARLAKKQATYTEAFEQFAAFLTRSGTPQDLADEFTSSRDFRLAVTYRSSNRLGGWARMVKRLVMIAALSVLLLGVGSFVTPAYAGHYTFDLTVSKRARLSNSHIILNVSGTYTCTDGSPDFDPNFSGIGGDVQQIHKDQVIEGGGGLPGSDLNCDGNPHDWTLQIQGFDSDGQPALWHGGRVSANIGGGIGSDEFCTHCAGDGFSGVIRVSG